MFSAIKSSTRLSLTIGCIFIGIIWIGSGLKLVPDTQKSEIESRVQICETLSITTSTLAESQSGKQIKSILTDTLERNPEILSIGLRNQQGELLFSIGEHESWTQSENKQSTPDMMAIAIMRDRRKWADLEMQFVPLKTTSSWPASWHPIPLMAFSGCAGILLVWLYLSRILKHLNPSKVVPTRVRTALDALAEGLILTDTKNHIVLANRAFKRIVSDATSDPQGLNPASFGWTYEGQHEQDEFPWILSFREGREHRGSILTHIDSEGSKRKFIVNSTPVFGEKNKCRGVLTSFDDVTVLEEKQDQLVKTLKVLQSSRDEIKRQNKELHILASIDPLSGCLNRRSFFEKFQAVWNRGDMLSTIMVDIDFFKKINDNHGHAVGDAFIRTTGEILRSVVGENGLVCRYGGEEFCVLLLYKDINPAVGIAEKINQTIASTEVEGLPFTASVGVSARRPDSTDPEHLLDEADKSLYAAKRRGRDQVVSWLDVNADDLTEDTSDDGRGEELPANSIEQSSAAAHALMSANASMSSTTIEALLSALAFRDRGTAEHSRRVANLAVEVASGILEENEIAELEAAALLHDVGKIGVPDAILLKAAPLNENEWKIMHHHDEISFDIVRAANASQQIADIVRSHHTRYSNGANDDTLSIGARILSVCDAFDAMTNDRVYRKGMSYKDAFAELRRSAPAQFDPTVVELLIHSMTTDPECIRNKTLDAIAPISTEQVETQVLCLQNAINKGRNEEFPTLLHQLITMAIASSPSPVLLSATDRLQAAMDQTDSEIDSLLSLTQEILDISRTAIEDSPQKTAPALNLSK